MACDGVICGVVVLVDNASVGSEVSSSNIFKVGSMPKANI